ncbi:peptidase M23, putative [Babesia caballi]|uniref:Peptidase M23, putative n=1 Tax=Babesia caballi TaxID=5871 RepID=A0AAV4LYH5_BABCB|nr:peptidase M23, putative [Babesia caballi]
MGPSVPALLDPQVSAFYDCVVRSGEFYSKGDLHALMKECGIRAARHRGRGREPAGPAGAAAQRDLPEHHRSMVKPARRAAGSPRSRAPPKTPGADLADPPSPHDKEVAQLRADAAELQKKIDDIQSSVGNTDSPLHGLTSSQCLPEKCAAIRHEIEVLESQNAAKRREALRNLAAEIKEADDCVARWKYSIAMLQNYITDTYVSPPGA